MTPADDDLRTMCDELIGLLTSNAAHGQNPSIIGAAWVFVNQVKACLHDNNLPPLPPGLAVTCTLGNCGGVKPCGAVNCPWLGK